MIASDIVTPDLYRAVPDERGAGFNVVRQSHVAHFDDEAHAAFLVDLLSAGQSERA